MMMMPPFLPVAAGKAFRGAVVDPLLALLLLFEGVSGGLIGWCQREKRGREREKDVSTVNLIKKVK